MTQQFILDFLKNHQSELKEQFGVVKIGLFGSYARNEATPQSDIDIAVEIESKNSFRSFFSLLYFLENGLKSKIDLGIEHSLKPAVKESILKDMIYV
jgi:hypothetical protein